LDYFIPDVSGEFIMDIAKILANSPQPMTTDAVHSCFPGLKTLAYTDSALKVCSQLGLAQEKNGLYIGSEKSRSDIKRSSKEQLFSLFQQSIMSYPPFLLYIDFGSKGYTSTDSAARTKGILKVRGSLSNVESSLRRWGIYSQLLDYNKGTDSILVKVPLDKLSADYVLKLLKAMEAELKVKIFMIDTLGPDVYAYLDSKDITLDNLSDALLEFEKDAVTAASKATKTLEIFLYKLGEDTNTNISQTNGPSELVDRLRGANQVLVKHQHIVHGLGAIRNMSSHEPDKETGKPWEITPAGGLISSLMVPITIRSIYLYYRERKQEF
jgi:hypothetical protein